MTWVTALAADLVWTLLLPCGTAVPVALGDEGGPDLFADVRTRRSREEDRLPSVADFLNPTLPAQQPGDDESERGFFESVGNTLWTVGKTFVLDMGYLAAAPLRITPEDFYQFAGGAGLIAVTMAVLDGPINGFVQRNHHKDLEATLGFFENAVSRPIETGLGIASFGLLLGDPKLARTGLEIVETDFVVELAVNAGKRVFGRSRPNQGEGPHKFRFMGGTVDGRRSFPSAGTANAFVIAVPFAEEYEGTAVPYVAYSVGALVALSRWERNAHWASDTLASALLSLAVGKALVWLHQQNPYPAIVPWLARENGDGVAGVAWTLQF